jgi:hypothetical protein
MRILLAFNYDRNQWLELLKPFFKNNTVHWIRYISKVEDQNIHLPKHSYHYWSDFVDGNEILAKIKPERIIVMDNKSPLNIALIYSAKKNGIPVYYLQHGVYGTYNDYKILERELKGNYVQRKSINSIKESVGFSTMRFFRKSLGLRFFHPRTLMYLLLVKILGLRSAAYYIKDKTRVVDRYLCFSKYNAKIHLQLDGQIADRVYVVGFPELEELVKEYEKVETSAIEQAYWLHIDQPLSGSDLGEVFVSEEVHFQVYYDLSKEAEKHNCKLYIKLHPGDYQRENLPEIDNIVYIKQTASMTKLIKEAKICTGFYSSLLLTCIAFKPTFLIKLFNISWYSDMGKYPNVKIIESSEGAFVFGVPPTYPTAFMTKLFLTEMGYDKNASFEEKALKYLAQ